MSINITNYSNNSLVNNESTTTNTSSNSNSKNTENTNSSSSVKTDSYESTKNAVSKEEIQKVLAQQAEEQAKNFQKLISSTFSKQANKANLTNILLNQSTGKAGTGLKDVFANLQVDAETARKAQEAISEDGYYGVNQTSERILSLAKAIAGNDPKKMQEMRNAVEKGFSKAEKMWGGELPEICQQTYDKVMSTFDSWQAELM